MPPADYRRVISGMIHVIRNGLRWRDVPEICSPHETPFNRFIRWSRIDVIDRTFAALAGGGLEPERITIDATQPKFHCKAARLLNKGMFAPFRVQQKGLQSARPLKH